MKPKARSTNSRYSANLIAITFLFFFSFLFFSFLLFSFLLFQTAATAYGGSQARSQIGDTVASLHHSHSNVGSELHLQTTPQPTAIQDPQPSERDQRLNPHLHGRVVTNPISIHEDSGSISGLARWSDSFPLSHSGNFLVAIFSAATQSSRDRQQPGAPPTSQR